MAALKILSEGFKGQKFKIDRDETTIGRSSTNVVSIENPSVSSKHCVILRDGKKFTIRDLDSTNGTFLNDLRITEYRLNPKDIVRVGAVEIQIDGDDIAADEAAAERTTVIPLAAMRAGRGTEIARTIGPSPFNARRERRHFWSSIIWLVAILTLLALGYFAYLLTRSG